MAEGVIQWFLKGKEMKELSSCRITFLTVALAFILFPMTAFGVEQGTQWPSMYGTIDTESGFLRMTDYPMNAGDSTYVYYDDPEEGSAFCSASFRILESGMDPCFTLRLEAPANPLQGVRLSLDKHQLKMAVYQGETNAASELEWTREESDHTELALAYDADRHYVTAYLNGALQGELPIPLFEGCHRFRLDFEDRSPNGRASCEVLSAILKHGEDVRRMIVLPSTFRMENEDFRVVLGTEEKAILSLRQAQDPWETEFLNEKAARPLGQLTIRYTNAENTDGTVARSVRTDNSDAQIIQKDTAIQLSWEKLGRSNLGANQQWELCGNELVWTFSISNREKEPVRICDIQIPLDFNTHFEKGNDNYTKRVIRHHFCSWDGSYAYWCRPNGEGGRLVMTPEPGTSLEYYDGADGFSMYIHSAFTGNQTEGAWLYPFTSTVLEGGETRTYSLHFRWAADDAGIRDAIYQMNGLDVISVPGMTVPCNMDAQVALRTQDGHPVLLTGDGCKAEWLREQGDYQIYRLRFFHVGEHQIEIRFGTERHMRLDYFVTEPIEDLLKARAKHLVRFQQYRGDAWYDGLFTQWNMETERFTTPDDAQGLYPYIVSGSDDPSLGKAPLIAQKNVYLPVREEIEAVEYYIDHFVWGKLQRTDQETPRPYAIYGCDSWYELRNSGTGFNNGGHGEDRMWRTFDYTHIIQLYYYMYQVAELYPELVQSLDADGYLMRAYHTAEAFFEIPITIFMEGWDFHGYCSWAFKQGNFGEIVIIPLIDALDASGHSAEAEKLRRYWETKVKYMVYDEPYPFGSEMVFDTTAFESTHAIAKYGLEHEVEPDTEHGFYDPNAESPGKGAYLPAHTEINQGDFLSFLKREQRANKAARCILEPAYYLMGSDIRGDNLSYLLSYMTQLGAEGILDTALYSSDNAAEDFRIAYASYLAGWMQINSGTGYPWYGSTQNQGAAAWGYQPIRGIEAWCGRGFVDGYGIWKVDGEIDCGFAGGLRMASTSLVNDPVFGLFYYGGRMEETDDGIQLEPADGVRQRMYLRYTDAPADILLKRDGIRKVTIRDNELTIELENRTNDIHENLILIKTEKTEQQISYTTSGENTYQIHVRLPERND